MVYIHEQGVYVGMPMEEYLADPSMSASGVKQILDNAARWWHNSSYNPQKLTIEKKHSKFGTALHMAVLEPELFDETYEIKPNVKSTMAEGWLGEGEYEQIEQMRDVIFSSDVRKTMLTGGLPEVSIFWRDADTGIPCRCRVDYFGLYGWVDLKTARDVRDGALRYDIPRYGYDVTGAMYSMGASALRQMIRDGYQVPDNFPSELLDAFMNEETLRFAFMMQEKEAPYLVRTLLLTPNVCEIGLEKMAAAATKYKLAVEKYGSKEWESEYPELENMELEMLSQSINYY